MNFLVTQRTLLLKPFLLPFQDLAPARSLTNFLGEKALENEEFEIDEVLPRWAKDTMNQEHVLVDESEPQQHGIIARGIANAGTRRGHVSPLDMHQNPGPGQLPATHFSGDTPLPVPMHQPTMSSSQMIQSAWSRQRTQIAFNDVHSYEASPKFRRP